MAHTLVITTSCAMQCFSAFVLLAPSCLAVVLERYGEAVTRPGGWDVVVLQRRVEVEIPKAAVRGAWGLSVHRDGTRGLESTLTRSAPHVLSHTVVIHEAERRTSPLGFESYLSGCELAEFLPRPSPCELWFAIMELSS